MVYWGWSLYTWALNATGTNRLLVRLGLLAAMATILLMAVVIPGAFGDEGKYFAMAYFAYRMIGTAVYYVAGTPEQRVTMFTFFPLATTAALVALAGGFVGQGPRPWVWVVSLAIDFAATRAAERVDWHMNPGHFAERYGLLVIVALGETVIAIGLGLTGAEINRPLGVTLVAAFVAVAALWWSYFDWVAAKVEARFRSLQGIPQGAFARDTYTMLHLPVIAGIVLFSVALEEIAAHPSDSLTSYGRWVMAAGVVLVLFAFVVAAYRIARQVPVERFVAAALVVGIALLGGGLAAQTVIVLVSGVLVGALLIETVRWKKTNPEDYARLH
jgi:low temperature requirement protein LtrA